MPKGERFYYRHKAKVIDGTPCNDESLDVCVNGQCQVKIGKHFVHSINPNIYSLLVVI